MGINLKRNKVKPKTSLAKKLFTITLLMILCLIAVTYISQTLLFEKFYSYKKTTYLVKQINKLNIVFSSDISSDDEFFSALKDFEIKNNAKLALYSPDENKIFLPDKSTSDKDNFDTLTAFCSELIKNKTLINTAIETSKTQYENFYNESSNLKKIGIVSPMSLNTKNDFIIICVSSIQPIEEATQVIEEFSLYLFIGLIGISAMLSMIYSDLVSKPLIKLNNVACKMAKMDFDEKCEITSNDEIGSLGKSLNSLSLNLKNALDDLKEKNAALRQDIEKEKQLENMRNDFVNNVSHELKTPIGIIEGYAEGIKDGIVSGEDSVLYLETIIDEAKKMGVLVSNMLELSKLESGVLKPNFEDFNINRLIKKVVRKHEPDASSKNLTILFESSDEYSYVYADPFQMEEVFTNLLTNAIKYTPSDNNIKIIISEDEELKKYKLSVQNFGTSIPEDELEKLFDKFYRIDKSRERTQSNSTGLGLSIVKNILNLHKAEFKFHNIDGGIEFYFYLDKVIMSE